MASQAATRALSPLPPSARHSDVHCDDSTIQMHVRCARAPPPAAAPTTSCCCPARSAHGGRGFVAGTMDFAAVGEKRGEGGGCRDHTASQAATHTLPPARRLLHPRPHASPLASWTPRSQPLLNCRRGVGGRRVCAPTPTVPPSPSTRLAAAPPPKLSCVATAACGHYHREEVGVAAEATWPPRLPLDPLSPPLPTSRHRADYRDGI
jgi:hypothetical protein